MNTTVNTFKDQQYGALEILKKLQVLLQQGENLGVLTDEKLNNQLTAKLKTAIDDIADEKLKVALVGGFSEGKTSIAAAWIEKLDKSSMKISNQESSNEVKEYDIDSDIILFDTPGLFGFKEQFNESTESIEKYKDITKKYVSQAHLVLYVMNSMNPIKESHKEDLIWLFRTLNLLPRTIFVLSRFDDVADVEDDEDYKQKLKIKRDNVTSRLQELIGLDESEEAQLAIIAVAANPFDMGTDYWLSNLDKFKELSHIELLQKATSEKIKVNGGVTAIVNETKKSIASDVLHRQMPVALENNKKIEGEIEKLRDMVRRLEEEKKEANQEISKAKTNLKEKILNYFSELISQARGLSIETYTEFFEREVGDEGIVLTTRLEIEFERQLGVTNVAINKIQTNFESEINHYNTAISTLGKQGLNYVVNSKLINGSTVLAARDGIRTVGKTIGMDLGNMLKFKPWGAVNLAKGLNGAIAIVGLGLELWDTWKQKEREDAFRKAIADTVKNLKNQEEEVLTLLKDDKKFKEQFFEGYIKLTEGLEEIKQQLEQAEENQRKFNEWHDAIDAEFTVLQG